MSVGVTVKTSSNELGKTVSNFDLIVMTTSSLHYKSHPKNYSCHFEGYKVCVTETLPEKLSAFLMSASYIPSSPLNWK